MSVLRWVSARTTLASLSSLHHQAYQREGFLVVDNMFSPEQMAAWKKIMAKSGVAVWASDETPPELLQGLCEGPMRDVLTTAISPNVEFLAAKPVIKSSQVTYQTPWHQDHTYWSGTHKLSAWVALDDANVKNGCLRIVPRSHTTVLPHATRQNTLAFEKLVEHVNEWSMVDVELPSGSVLFMHDLLLHASHPNTSGEDRFALIPVYRDGAEPDSCESWPVSKLVAGRSVNKGCM